MLIRCTNTLRFVQQVVPPVQTELCDVVGLTILRHFLLAPGPRVVRVVLCGVIDIFAREDDLQS